MHESDIDESPAKTIASKTSVPVSENTNFEAADNKLKIFRFIEKNCFCPINRTIIPKDQVYTDSLKLLNQIHVKSKNYVTLKCACSEEFHSLSIQDLGKHADDCKKFQNREVSGQFVNSLNQNLIHEHFKNTNECAICMDKVEESFSDHYFSEKHQRYLNHQDGHQN